MTRRFFFGLIPALLAAAKWPIEKLRGNREPPCYVCGLCEKTTCFCGLNDSVDGGFIIPKKLQPHAETMLMTQEMLDGCAIPATWLEDKLRSEINLNV